MPPRKKSKYEVGYCRPPKTGQFQKGVSGNPHGRPKGSLNVSTVLQQVARETITINENGVRRKVTKLEAAAMQMSNKSASGDLKAMNMMFNLLRMAELQSSNEPDKPLLSNDDKTVIGNMLKRFASAKEETK